MGKSAGRLRWFVLRFGIKRGDEGFGLKVVRVISKEDLLEIC